MTFGDFDVTIPHIEYDHALIERERLRRHTAIEIIDELDVLGHWARFGEPRIVGAMAYQLMVAHDIDVEIFGPLDTDSGFSIVAHWAKNPAVKKVLFMNALDGEDSGLGWEVSFLHSTGTWKLQMWLLPADHEGSRAVDFIEPIKAALTMESRCAVLRIKEALLAEGLSYRSLDVYRAAIDGGICDIQEYLQWCEHSGSEDLIAWRPRLTSARSTSFKQETSESFRSPTSYTVPKEP